MRTVLFIAATSLFLTVSVTNVLPNVLGQEEAGVGRQSRLEELLKQRREMLTRAVEMRVQQYLRGACGFEAVLAARRHLYQAELDAAKTREDRVAALERQLKVAATDVTIAEQMFHSGRVTNVDVLLARAALISVKIKLLREQGKVEQQDRQTTNTAPDR